MVIFWLCIAFLAGIATAGSIPAVLFQPFVIGGITASALAMVWRRSRGSLPLMLVAAFAFGLARFSAQPAAESGWMSTGSIEVVGVVEQVQSRRDDYQGLVLAVEERIEGGERVAASGQILVQLGALPRVKVGDRILARGRLEQLRLEDGDGYDVYLRRQGVDARIEYPDVQVSEPGRGLRSALAALNDRLRLTIGRLLPEPHAGLLAGMTLGTPGTIDRQVLEDFRASGTSHLLVISGWNITVLVGAVTGVLASVGLLRRHALLLTLPVLAAYVLFVGASPSVVRAGIMGALVVWAELADRESDAWTGLLLACALLALHDPNVLWDTGFQLSALATAGILLCAKPLRAQIERLPLLGHRQLAAIPESLAMTLAALLLTLPVQLYTFGTLALVAPLANLVVAPAVPYAMFFGGLGAAVALVSEPFGQLLALLAWPFTTWMIGGARLFAQLPGATMLVPSFGTWWLGLWYAGIAAIVLLRQGKGQLALLSMSPRSVAPPPVVEVPQVGEQVSAPTVREGPL